MRLLIRFDEFSATGKLKAAPSKRPGELDGTTPSSNALQVVKDPSDSSGNRLLLLPPGASPAESVTPQSASRSSDGLTFDVMVLPKDCSWSQNGLRTADQLTATIKYVDCPVDPRVIRACAVEVWIGTVDEQTFATSPRGFLPATYTDEAGRPRTNLRFQGWVDKWVVEKGDGEPVIRIECRDNTQLVLNQPIPSKAVVDAKLPLAKAVANYLRLFPQCAGLTVEYQPADDVQPVLGTVLQPTATRPQLGPQVSKGDQKANAWDYLTDVCGSVGHMIRIDGSRIIIQKAKSFTTRSTVRRFDDPFRGRTINGERFEYRRFIYGRNVKELKIARSFVKGIPQNFEVRCFLHEKKTVLVGRFPEEKDEQKYALPGNTQPDKKWIVRYVSGINSNAAAKTIAQAYYENHGRQELGIEIQTNNLGSFGGGNTDPDILDMKPGDTFELLTRNDNEEKSTVTKLESILLSSGKSEALLRKLGFEQGFARVYAKTVTDAGFITQFRVKSMKTEWSIDEGIRLSVVGMNYVEIRADALLTDGGEPSNVAINTAPGSGFGQLF